MKLKTQKRIAAKVLKCGLDRVKFDVARLNEIKEAITKSDIRRLIGMGAISLKQKHGISSYRANKIRLQKRKGKRKGPGSRKGTRHARLTRKRRWIQKVRVQRGFLRLLKEKKLITTQTNREIYTMIKGNVFRSKRHIKLFLEENKLFKKKPFEKSFSKTNEKSLSKTNEQKSLAKK
ncbi:50S ribosomal protein L19e [Candidatus Woesearchaeota archaeon]|nr:50S ribosomal protein L19e [Candidatus Woesearchaeota archaeon]